MFKDMDYNQFWLSRLSLDAQPVYFTKEEREWALRQADYKYFGDYEMDDSQRIALEILVWATEHANGAGL